MFICKPAREHGIKVLLSGAGGDDIFTGYRRHVALQQERYWAWLSRTARQGLSRLTSRLPTGVPALRRLRKACEYAALDGRERLVSYFYWLGPDSAARAVRRRRGLAAGAGGSGRAHRRGIHNLRGRVHRVVVSDIFG